jgi:hypothetical protein
MTTYVYEADDGTPSYRKVRYAGKQFLFQHPDAGGGWTNGLNGQPHILYHQPAIRAAVAAGQLCGLAEGEKDADRVTNLGIPTTTSDSTPQWTPDYSEVFRGADVVIFADNDATGRECAERRAAALHGIAHRVRVCHFTELPDKGDVSDWLELGNSLPELMSRIEALPDWTPPEDGALPPAQPSGVTLDDFHAYMPAHSYIFVPSRDLWPAASVNARVPPVEVDGPSPVRASVWLDAHRSVEQMTWAPGEPMLIEGRLIDDGGWIDRPGCRTFNLYRPPQIALGEPDQAGRWLDHVHRVYPDDADHIIRGLAHRVQRPSEKINHALVLGGAQGIGKDTLLEPVKHGVGPWNFREVSPIRLLGRFNGFVKAVILRVSEARDLGDVNRFAFYDHLKVYTAAPPDVLACDEKNIRDYTVLNVCGVILTTNHKTNGIYLPADDRRHFVAWSDLTKEDFAEDYWRDLWGWYELGGHGHVAAYLAALDLTGFDAKAPPPKTPAFWAVVDANRAPEDAELADALDALGNPDAVTLSELTARVSGSTFGAWLQDRRNSRQIPHRLEAVGYVAVRNDAATDGRWRVDGRRQVVYANQDLPPHDQQEAARRLAEANRRCRP